MMNLFENLQDYKKSNKNSIKEGIWDYSTDEENTSEYYDNGYDTRTGRKWGVPWDFDGDDDEWDEFSESKVIKESDNFNWDKWYNWHMKNNLDCEEDDNSLDWKDFLHIINTIDEISDYEENDGSIYITTKAPMKKIRELIENVLKDMGFEVIRSDRSSTIWFDEYSGLDFHVVNDPDGSTFENGDKSYIIEYEIFE